MFAIQIISFILKTVKINNFDQALKNYNIMILKNNKDMCLNFQNIEIKSFKKNLGRYFLFGKIF
jgi:hypothetical protein